MTTNKKNTNQSIFFFIDYWVQYLIIAALIILVSILFPKGESLQYAYQINDIAHKEIIAPFTFPIIKSEEKLNYDLAERKQSIPYIFNRNDQIVSQGSSALNEFFVLLNDLRIASYRLEESRRLVYERRYHKQYEKAKSELISDSTNFSLVSKNFFRLYPFTDSKESWVQYINIKKDSENIKTLKMHNDLILQICRNRWTEGIYDIKLKEITSRKVTVNQGDVPDLATPNSFNDLEMAWTKSKKEFLANLLEDDPFRDIGFDLIVEFMKPNLLFDQQLTERRQKESLDKVPRSQGVVLENELIVDANMRITNDVLQKLNSLSNAVMKNEKKTGIFKQLQGLFGRIILVSVIISLFFSFLLFYRPKIFHDWTKVLLIAILFFLQIGLANIILIQINLSEYILPITMGAMSLTILFDARIGFMATTSIVLLIGLMTGQNIDLVIVSLFSSTIAIYNIRELRKRSQLFTTMFALMASSVFVIVGLGLFKDNSWDIIFNDMQFLVLNSFLAPILTYGLIGIFEMFFNVTTNLTLIELLDYDHPLLKRAQQETNGTFNHSIVVGNLAEACANAIGAHSLLCRVGAYYHDIGKMEKSEYFIENQYGAENKHNKLTHNMSARIIRAHVNEGLKLAQEHGLPKIVSDFIPMHHGTTRVEYFYRLALKEAEKTGAKVDESSFRYPGPKPNTRETGILMLCEAIEAAVRSIKDPDIFKIEAMIDKIIQQRIEDGQLDECPLTLDELNKIKGKVDGNSGMLPVLRGIYHIRVEYPDEPKNKVLS
tara:strand:- start:13 stop:2331 length:2319 start_codon:yes stop_codon:yes gene_type:complete